MMLKIVTLKVCMNEVQFNDCTFALKVILRHGRIAMGRNKSEGRMNITYLLGQSSIFTGWPRHRENGEFGYQIFQTGKTGNLGTTQEKFGQHREFSQFA